MHAVFALARLDARAEVAGLGKLLAEAPPVTWGLQIAILDAMGDMSLSVPEAEHLLKVDNLHIQAALGSARTTR